MFGNKNSRKLTSILINTIPSNLRIEKRSEDSFYIIDLESGKIYDMFSDSSFSLNCKPGSLKIGSVKYHFYSNDNRVYLIRKNH